MPKRDATDELDLSVHAIADSLRAISQSLKQCADRISTPSSEAHAMLQEALRLIYKTGDTADGKLVFAGVGKSYLVGKKLAATMTSVGTLAVSMHATEAVHGDLGLIRANDCVVLLSYSGCTDEVVRLAAVLRAMRPTHPGVLIGMSGAAQADSPLGKLCDAWIDCKVDAELSSAVCAPTTSSSLMLAMGDAIAMLLMARRNFGPADFVRNHPGGQLGRRLHQHPC
ncbi:hypothetical protein GGI23_002559 [Coemansia sp. RSA 2559]|nr:hypothetical protein GGI23_002559 [Coemansia sp. RSA 2559]